VDPHHHRVEPRSVRARGRVVHGDDIAPRVGDRSQQTSLSTDEHRCGATHEARGRVGRRDDAPAGFDARGTKPAGQLVVGGRRAVRDEPHLEARVLEHANAVVRSRNRIAAEPDDSVHVARNCSAGCHTVSVPRFEAFRALRYSPLHPLSDVVAPPYDVIDRRQRDQYAARSSRNIVHVDVPVGPDPDRYGASARTLAAWVDEGTLVRDPLPSFTIYRMSFDDELGRTRGTVGVIGALEVVDLGSAEVLPHERTTPKDSTDRLDLTRATSANLSPVWGLSLRPGLAELLDAPAEFVGEVVSADGARHRFERVADPARVAAISAAVSSKPVLIADGHHRYSISRTYRDEVGARGDGLADAAQLVLAYVAELAETSLSVAAIHRVYSSPDADELLRVLSDRFDAEPAGAVGPGVLAEMQRRGSSCLVAPGGLGTWLTPRADRFVGVRDLDSARLEAALEGTDATVAYQHGLQQTLDRLADGATAAVLIRPVSIPEILRTATEGLLMPPKSTFFTPKLLTGPVIRVLQPD
jgi:uncharacterized protein (DUF1015 family)